MTHSLRTLHSFSHSVNLITTAGFAFKPHSSALEIKWPGRNHVPTKQQLLFDREELFRFTLLISTRPRTQPSGLCYFSTQSKLSVMRAMQIRTRSPEIYGSAIKHGFYLYYQVKLQFPRTLGPQHGVMSTCTCVAQESLSNQSVHLAHGWQNEMRWALTANHKSPLSCFWLHQCAPGIGLISSISTCVWVWVEWVHQTFVPILEVI